MKGHGKVTPLGILQKSPEYEEVFSQLGDTWSVSEDIITKLEVFLCTVYGKMRMKDVNSVRFMKIDEICGDKNHKASLRNFDMAS